MLIVAHAVSLGLILVTANFRELSQISGLGVENWINMNKSNYLFFYGRYINE